MGAMLLRGRDGGKDDEEPRRVTLFDVRRPGIGTVKNRAG